MKKLYKNNRPKFTNMKVQYMSDLHLEMSPGFRLEAHQVVAPYLILAGDIGNLREREYTEFLEHCSKLFMKVFVIVGNHELYNGHVQGNDNDVNDIIFANKFNNVFVLNVLNVLNENEYYDLEDDFRIIGSTLWSYVPPECAADVKCFVADYRRIGGMREVTDSNALHARHVEAIKMNIQAAIKDKKKLIIVSHHAPSTIGTSHPSKAGSPLNSAYATNLDYLICEPVAVWVHGHTHFSLSLIHI